MPRRHTLVLACLASVAVSTAAWAKPKVALTAIDGDASGDVHDAVEEALQGGKEVSLIGDREVTRAVDKIGDVADLTEKDLRKLSIELEADAIVIGKLDKAGGAKSLKFRIYVHKKLAKGFTISFKDARSAKFQAVLHDKLIGKIGVAPGSGGDDAADADSDADARPVAKKGKKGKKGKPVAADADADADADARPAKKLAKGDKLTGSDATADADADAKPVKKKPADADADARPAKDADEDAPKKKQKVAAADEASDGEADASVSASAAPAPGAKSTATPAIRIDVGPSILQHTYKFAVTAGVATPKGSSLAPTPGVRLAGDFYPFWLSDAPPKGALAGLGIGGYLDHTLALKLTAKNGATAQQTSVKQMN